MKIARSIVAALIFVGVAAVEVSAQLAITEVFAASSNNLLPDYWELTNFGSDDLNLDGYGFQDGDPADLPRIHSKNGKNMHIFFNRAGPSPHPSIRLRHSGHGLRGYPPGG